MAKGPQGLHPVAPSLAVPGKIAGRVLDDARRSEIRLVELPKGVLDVDAITGMGEMLLDPFKLCLFGASACTTSLVGYAQPVRQASTVLPSADITFNQNWLDAANNGAGVKYEKPDSVSFNTCMDGNTAGGTLKKCVNSQAVYPLCEQNGLEAQERRYTAHEEGKH